MVQLVYGSNTKETLQDLSDTAALILQISVFKPQKVVIIILQNEYLLSFTKKKTVAKQYNNRVPDI